jgi:hypothetical protein
VYLKRLCYLKVDMKSSNWKLDMKNAEIFLDAHLRRAKEMGLLNNPDGIKGHCKAVSLETTNNAQKIVDNYGELFPMDVRELEPLAYLHDTGRTVVPSAAEQINHEYWGAVYLDGLGMNRVARAICSHYWASELIAVQKARGNKLFANVNPEEYLPGTWQEVLVTSGDAVCAGNKVVPFYDRILDLKTRYADDEVTMATITMAEPRLTQLYEDVESLKAGEANTSLITKYVFL